MLFNNGATGSSTTTLNWDTSSVTKMNYMFSELMLLMQILVVGILVALQIFEICFGRQMFLIMGHLLGYQQL